MDRKNVKHQLREIEVVLWEDWDPIGVNECSGAKGEYDSYAGHIFTIASETRSAIAIAEQLVSVEHASMGLRRRDPRAVLSIAEKILKIVEKD